MSAYQPHPDVFFRRIVLDAKTSIKNRLSALRNMSKPSLALLLTLLNSENTPERLRILAAERYAAEQAVRRMMHSQAKAAKTA